MHIMLVLQSPESVCVQHEQNMVQDICFACFAATQAGASVAYAALMSEAST